MFMNGDYYKNKNLGLLQRKKTMNSKQIRNFIMFYERITKNMLKDLSKKAEFVIKIDDKHTLTSIQSN